MEAKQKTVVVIGNTRHNGTPLAAALAAHAAKPRVCWTPNIVPDFVSSSSAFFVVDLAEEQQCELRIAEECRGFARSFALLVVGKTPDSRQLAELQASLGSRLTSPVLVPVADAAQAVDALLALASSSPSAALDEIAAPDAEMMRCCCAALECVPDVCLTHEEAEALLSTLGTLQAVAQAEPYFFQCIVPAEKARSLALFFD